MKQYERGVHCALCGTELKKPAPGYAALCGKCGGGRKHYPLPEQGR